MTDPFVAEIRIFAGNFAPRGWAMCDGTILPISQNTALFSLLGTTYGGNGISTFGLPDLRGRAPMFWGQGPGLSPHVIGEAAGAASVTLTGTQIPQHNHALQASGGDADAASPIGALPGLTPSPAYRSDRDSQAAGGAISATGGGQPHPNEQPYLTLTFIIALQGIYPPRG